MISLLLVLAVSTTSPAVQGPPATCLQETQAAPAVAVGRDWIINAVDHICGLRDASQLTNPALIDFQACLDATPEMKEVKDKGIDPSSAKGIKLRSEAVTRITKACRQVSKSAGHCSVWKTVRHKDGRAISDVTSQVIAKF